jgi:hypothetical protein
MRQSGDLVHRQFSLFRNLNPNASNAGDGIRLS